jgi:hypothetical protein
MKLWIIDFMTTFHPSEGELVVMQCDHEPTEREAESAVHEAYYTGGTVYVDSITETSERELRGKKYYLVGAK